MNKIAKKIATITAAMTMAVSMMSMTTSAYSSNWSFSWTYGANNQYAKPYTNFDIKIGKATESVTSSGKKYTCYYVRTTPYVSHGSALSWVDNPQAIEVEFTCPSLTLEKDYMGDTKASGHVAKIDFIRGRVNYHYSKTIKAYAHNYSHYNSVFGQGTAYSYD